MSENAGHPSRLELDRHCLGVGHDASTAAHLADCARCREYVTSYRPAIEPADALPSKASAPERPRRTRARLAWAGSVALVAFVFLALVALVFLRFCEVTPDRYDPYVESDPSAALVVRHGNVLTPWDGAPARMGDHIVLKVMPGEFEHVAVFHLPASGGPERLYTGRLRPRATATLPKAWQFSPSREPGQLGILFSHVELSDEAAKVLLRARDPHEGWLVRLVLPKQGDASVDPEG